MTFPSEHTHIYTLVRTGDIKENLGDELVQEALLELVQTRSTPNYRSWKVWPARLVQHSTVIRAHSLVMQELDLRQYAREIVETELRRVEYHSVRTRLYPHTHTLDLDRDQSRNIAKLHGQIKDCDGILAVSVVGQ